MGSKLENLFFNKHPFAQNGLRADCRCHTCIYFLFLQEQLKGIIISRLRQLANHRESAAAAAFLKKKIVAESRCGSRGGSYGSKLK
jgi:hypothetical protein